MVQPYVKRELGVYGGAVAAVVVSVALAASYLSSLPARYVLMPLAIGTLFVGGILAGASDSGPGLVGEGNVSGEGGEMEGVRGDFTPGDSSSGVVPSIRSRPVVFTLFGVAFWSLVGLAVTAVLL
jgi:hypothetical protein